MEKEHLLPLTKDDVDSFINLLIGGTITIFSGNIGDESKVLFSISDDFLYDHSIIH